MRDVKFFSEETDLLLAELDDLVIRKWKALQRKHSEMTAEIMNDFTDTVYGVSVLFPLAMLRRISGGFDNEQFFDEFFQNIKLAYNAERNLGSGQLAISGPDNQPES
jgi:hypothetical protein